MSFFSVLYNLLIGPLELFFEVLYAMVNRIINNPGFSIIFLSLAMNFLVLPLYKMADALQAEEQATEAKMKKTVTHIKKTFKGDERFMMLQAYYRENNYRPTDTLKGSVSLLLEIPFFMAAYNFLSGLPILHGASLGPIQNLAEPDAMLIIGSITINILPVLMTVINLISSAIYTKGASLRSKVQLYVMAGLFLILLYNSPSGLVFYWTLNNLFSLVKNIFMKLKNPQKVFCGLTSVFGVIALVVAIITRPMPTFKSQILLCCLILMLQIPLTIYVIAKRIHYENNNTFTKKDRKTFWAGGLFLTALLGAFIPSGVIHASPEEFLNTATQISPLFYIFNTILTAAGFFLIWFGIFYMLAKNQGKRWMSYGICAISIIAVVDFMFFGNHYGNMSSNLVFDVAPKFVHSAGNFLLIILICIIVYLFWSRKQEMLRFILLTATLAVTVISVANMFQIQKVIANKSVQLQENSEDMPVIPLSRNGKNVIVLMLDRAISGYIPYIMNEKPELKEQFDGFTYYPNTISFGPCTNIGAPALFGGYEYTPEELNKRSSESLEDKTNEALKVMPALFYDEGFEVTVCDPPCAGFDWIPDLSIYDEYPKMHTFNTMGKFDPHPEKREMHFIQTLNRNFFCYSVFKSSPVALQTYIYDGGNYNNLYRNQAQFAKNVSIAEGENPDFIDSYYVLDNLPEITEIHDEGLNTFMMLANNTTHSPMILQEPEYLPADNIDNSLYDMENSDRFLVNNVKLEMNEVKQVSHYHVNMAALLKLGEWFDYLRSENLYDNSRIIIVADHGFFLEQFENSKFGKEPRDEYMLYNPLFMVKDFNSSGFHTISDFMTNADTSSIAMKDIIQTPVNPFTGNTLSNAKKFSQPQHIFCGHGFNQATNPKNVFLKDFWYSVYEDIFDLDNWEYLGVK